VNRQNFQRDGAWLPQSPAADRSFWSQRGENEMIKKFLFTVALAGMAFTIAPSFATAQGILTEGEGGVSASTPGAGTAQGPLLQPARPAARVAQPTRTRHAKRSRHVRSTVGSR
jgi:hypothetical protein